VIFKDLRSVIEFDSSKVNFHHLALLCDLMTHRSHLVAITRHGINCADTGALMRLSFEGTAEVLMAMGERRLSRYLGEHYLWTNGPIGTGSFDVRVTVDIDMLKDAIIDRLGGHHQALHNSPQDLPPSIKQRD
jgi:DNA-directed RNA polymerase II subunit RPB1